MNELGESNVRLGVDGLKKSFGNRVLFEKLSCDFVPDEINRHTRLAEPDDKDFCIFQIFSVRHLYFSCPFRPVPGSASGRQYSIREITAQYGREPKALDNRSFFRTALLKVVVKRSHAKNPLSRKFKRYYLDYN